MVFRSLHMNTKDVEIFSYDIISGNGDENGGENGAATEFFIHYLPSASVNTSKYPLKTLVNEVTKNCGDNFFYE